MLGLKSIEKRSEFKQEIFNSKPSDFKNKLFTWAFYFADNLTQLFFQTALNDLIRYVMFGYYNAALGI